MDPNKEIDDFEDLEEQEETNDDDSDSDEKIDIKDNDLDDDVGEDIEENVEDNDEEASIFGEDSSDVDDIEDDIEDVENTLEDNLANNKKTKSKTTKQTIQINSQYGSDYDSEEEDDYDDDENYLQKFSKEINKQYIEREHPECIFHNYNEISALTKVIRDKNNNIIDPLHRTVPFLTKYEKTRIIGQRAKQINSGAKPFVSVPQHIIDGYIIAELELKQKKIPFIIKRPIPGGGSEYWNVKELELI